MALEKARQEQMEAKQKLEDLDHKQRLLGDFISKVKQYSVAEATDVSVWIQKESNRLGEGGGGGIGERGWGILLTSSLVTFYKHIKLFVSFHI